jgi:hypothetical protein
MEDRSLHQLFRERLIAQANLFAALTSHPTLTGGARERALRALLREVLPRRYEVLDGTIVSLDATGKPRKTDAQIDTMVVDTFDYPTLLREGETAIVLPHAVRAIVEIKTDLAWTEKPAQNPFLKALRQIGALRLAVDPNNLIPVTLFSYNAPSTCATLRSWLRRMLEERERLRSLADASVTETESMSVRLLAADRLPERIICDTGVIAVKVEDGSGTAYRFHDNSLGRDVASAVVYLVDDIVQRTSAHVDPLGSEAFRLFQQFIGGTMLHETSEERLIISSESHATKDQGGRT